MKYKIGDKVRIKSIDWYNENKDKYGAVPCGFLTFYANRNKYCGKVFTIYAVLNNCYLVKEDTEDCGWTDEMIEGLVEEETHRGYYTTEVETTNESKKVAWFTFWDNDFADKVELDLSNRELIQEDGKWFVVKKKKEYPKTFEECADYIESCYDKPFCADLVATGYKSKLIESFAKLLICRDAYWKIAGEKMGLGKPWEPDWTDEYQEKYIIGSWLGTIQGLEENFVSHTFAFPTEEMRDAFKENFDPDIEICKEFL